MAEAPEVPQPPSPPPQSSSLDSEDTSFMPPWTEATCSVRLALLWYHFLIYLPVVILISLILAMPVVYFLLYFLPMVVSENDRSELYFWHSGREHVRARIVGSVCLGLEQIFVFLLVWSFYQAVTTSPGTVPDTTEWVDLQAAELTRSHLLQEKKHTNGAVRWCRNCDIVKPDRSHHCRLCDTCVLKMDHHCPWIANCVGFYNYKYFVLMLTYGMLALWVFSGTFWETVLIALRDDDRSISFTFWVTLAYLLMLVLAFAVTLFWCFHVYLTLNSATTIEYCEKQVRTSDSHPRAKFRYYESIYKSLQCALGRRPAFWLLPCHYREPDETGLYFVRSPKAV